MLQFSFMHKGECTDGDIRLVDGETDYDGRVEVCKEGAWGAICSTLWDANDAVVACRQLNISSEGTYMLHDEFNTNIALIPVARIILLL